MEGGMSHGGGHESYGGGVSPGHGSGGGMLHTPAVCCVSGQAGRNKGRGGGGFMGVRDNL